MTTATTTDKLLFHNVLVQSMHTIMTLRQKTRQDQLDEILQNIPETIWIFKVLKVNCYIYTLTCPECCTWKERRTLSFERVTFSNEAIRYSLTGKPTVATSARACGLRLTLKVLTSPAQPSSAQSQVSKLGWWKLGRGFLSHIPLKKNHPCLDPEMNLGQMHVGLKC